MNISKEWTTHHGKVRWRLTDNDRPTLCRRGTHDDRWRIFASFEGRAQAKEAMDMASAILPPLPGATIPGYWGPDPRARLMELRSAMTLERAYAARQTMVPASPSVEQVQPKRVVDEDEAQRVVQRAAELSGGGPLGPVMDQLQRETGLSKSTIYRLTRQARCALTIIDGSGDADVTDERCQPTLSLIQGGRQ